MAEDGFVPRSQKAGDDFTARKTPEARVITEPPKKPTAIAKLQSKIPFAGTPEEIMAAREDPARSTIKYQLPFVNPATKLGIVGGMVGAGALGGAQQLALGKMPTEAGWSALVDAAVDGMLRGGAGIVKAGAQRLAKPLLDARANFQWAADAPKDALSMSPRWAGG